MAPSPQDSFLVVPCTSVGHPEGGGASSTLPHLVTVWVLVLLTLGPVYFVLHQPLSVQACSLAVSEHWPSSHPTPACLSQGPGYSGQDSQQTTRCGGMPHSASLKDFSPASACVQDLPLSPLASQVTGLIQPCSERGQREHSMFD